MTLGCPAPQKKSELLKRLKEILALGWKEMPANVARYNGSGGPGNYLEDLLGLTTGNQDIADCIGWEVKFFTPRTSLIMLFHKEPEPKIIMRYMVSQHGWKDKYGRLSFRHTIKGQSDRFIVVDDAGNVVVRPLHGDEPVPMWSHDTLLNVAGGKLRRLVAVEGRRKANQVSFDHADLYEKMHLTQLVHEMVKGRIAIDFDVREDTPGSVTLRNHGTKFRVSPKDLHHLYFKCQHLG